MAKFTQDMKDIMEKSKIYIIATASRDGKPNGVPAGAKIISDDEIMIVDYLMNKTRENIAENPVVSITCWDLEVHYGYQFKGEARVETSGELFDKAVELRKARSNDELELTVKAVVVVKVAEAYYIGIKDSRQNLFPA